MCNRSLNAALSEGIECSDLSAFGCDGGIDGGTAGVEIGGDMVLFRELWQRNLSRSEDGLR